MMMVTKIMKMTALIHASFLLVVINLSGENKMVQKNVMMATMIIQIHVWKDVSWLNV